MRRLKCCRDPAALRRPGGLSANKNVRRFRVRDTVVELRHVPLPDQRTKLPQAAGLLRDGHGKQPLAVLAHLRALGNKPQPVEIHVRPARDRHQGLAFQPAALDIRLRPRHRQSPGRFEHGARVLKHILDRSADVVGIHPHHFVEVRPAQSEGLLPHLPDRHAVGKQPDAIQFHQTAGLDRLVHRIRVKGLDPNDLDPGIQRLHVGRDPRRNAAAPDGHEDRMQRPLMLLQDFPPDRSPARR